MITLIYNGLIKLKTFKDNGRAGNLYSKPVENLKFQLTSAEIHLNNYYNNLNEKNANKNDKESDKTLLRL